MNFIAPDTIPSGWITFRFTNKSDMVHFAVLEKMPEGKTIKDSHEEVAPVFQNIMDNINGKQLSTPDAGMDLPEWFSKIVFSSGVGLISPAQVGETTVHIEPGTYLIECYVKSNGIFHSFNPDPEVYGMLHQFNATATPSSGVAPVPTVDVNISTEKGIEILKAPEAGHQTIAVHFLDQKVYGNFLGHDVHLFRLLDSTDVAQVASWIDWTQPKGLETPAPAAQFIGGTHEMAPGSTGYFHVTLTHGDYAFIAEVPDPASVGMLKQFSIEVGN
jgi:uncharacterized cupredoxin-like copper-binding protein